MTIEPLKPTRKSRQLSVGFPDEMRDRIKACAEKADCHEADIVRLLVGEGIDNLEVQLKIKRRRK